MTSATATFSTPAAPPEPASPGRRPRLLVSCPDRPGIVAAVASFLREAGANITHSAQYSTDPHDGVFFLRVQFELDASAEDFAAFKRAFDTEVADRFGMTWTLADAAHPKRMAVLVSRYDHCLLDVLWRWRRGELHANIAVVISNHEDLREDVEAFGLPFVHVPVEKGRKAEAEARQLEVLQEYGPVEVVVLARYMQVLSGEFLERVGTPVINIHHSFLPAFAGAGPYQRAKDRGVKLVGATAHYVTEDLDAGPIIEQDVVRVSHENDAPTLERLGADIERVVFARAVQWHCEDRVLVHGNTTVVF
ncbi:Formyltetrahydrofolate deformylase [Baekduia alba]|uniref:formyltetrahydrofolate deformylase n=1 Tax=Baekduia alba TaxID=2997333 RepID=UPI00233F9CE6|nr:formyltetrahydrofolate deformylase [Baekduia alba]WCB94898.1 Formyltetrahydrofolate deformylase [Baekduia alba]